MPRMPLCLDILTNQDTRATKKMETKGAKIHCTLGRRSDILKTLQASQAFVGVSQESLEKLIAQCDVYHYTHDQDLVHQGDPSQNLYFLLCGALRLKRHAVIIADINATPPSIDNMIGEIGLLDHGPSVVTVTASSLLGVECLVVPQPIFESFLAANPRFGRALHKVVASRVRQNMLLMDDLCTSAMARSGKTSSSLTTPIASDGASTMDGTTSAESSVKTLPAAPLSMMKSNVQHTCSTAKKHGSIFSRDADTSDIMESLLGLEGLGNVNALSSVKHCLSAFSPTAPKKEEQKPSKEEQAAPTTGGQEEASLEETDANAKKMARQSISIDSGCITDGKKEDHGEDVEFHLPPQWSFGARHHDDDQCNPCGFYYKSGCNQGHTCKFCHMCNTREKYKERKRKRVNQVRKNKELKLQDTVTFAHPLQHVQHTQHEDKPDGEEADSPGSAQTQKMEPGKKVRLELCNKHHVQHTKASFSNRYDWYRTLPSHLIHAAKLRAAYNLASLSSMYAPTRSPYATRHYGSMIAQAHTYASYFAPTALHAQNIAASALGSSAPYCDWSSAGSSNSWQPQKSEFAEQHLPACIAG